MVYKNITPQTKMHLTGLFTVGGVGLLQMSESEKEVINFSVCFNDVVTRGGNKTKLPVWVDCELWGNAARSLSKNVDIGDTLYLGGRMRAPRHFTHNGNKTINLCVDVDYFTIVKKSQKATGGP